MTPGWLSPRRVGGGLAVMSLALALVVANSPLAGMYQSVHHLPVGLHAGALTVERPLILWINEGLMVFFFLAVTLEIKRELIEGHLARWTVAALPAAAALGGMVVPAAIYATVTWADQEALRGWAVPTATDVVLALAVLSLAGTAATTGQRAFLMTLAVLDDVGGIVIIATFYAGELVLSWLVLAGVVAMALAVFNLLGVQRLAVFGVAGALLWLVMLDSGVNATLTGVIVGAAIPLRTDGEHPSPLKALESRLEVWVLCVIVPLFVFFNGGLGLADVRTDLLATPIGLGIVVGLMAGKPLGILGGAWIGVRLGLAERPPSLRWIDVVGVGLLGGIGFTVSLFLAPLAFRDPEQVRLARLAILIGSSASALLALVILRAARRRVAATGR